MKEEEVNILILKYLEGAGSDEERRRLERWLAEDERHRRRFDELASIIRELDQIDFRLEPETGAEWEKLRGQLQLTRGQSSVKPARRFVIGSTRTARLLAAAAAVAVLIAAGWLLSIYLRSEEPAPVAETFAAPRGGARQVDLPDGSRVRLNADTRLSVAAGYGRRERRVLLDGEAYFEVRPDTRAPFIVQTGPVFVRVLGTTFAVEAYPEVPSVRVAVVEGRVQFGAEGRQGLTLGANSAARFEKNTARFETLPFDTQTALDWLDGRLVFSDQLLSDIFPTLERRYNIRIDDQAGLGEQRFSDTVEKDEPLAEAMNRLVLTFSITYRQEGDTIVLLPR